MELAGLAANARYCIIGPAYEYWKEMLHDLLWAYFCPRIEGLMTISKDHALGHCLLSVIVVHGISYHDSKSERFRVRLKFEDKKKTTDVDIIDNPRNMIP